MNKKVLAKYICFIKIVPVPLFICVEKVLDPYRICTGPVQPINFAWLLRRVYLEMQHCFCLKLECTWAFQHIDIRARVYKVKGTLKDQKCKIGPFPCNNYVSLNKSDHH